MLIPYCDFNPGRSYINRCADHSSTDFDGCSNHGNGCVCDSNHCTTAAHDGEDHR